MVISFVPFMVALLGTVTISFTPSKLNEPAGAATVTVVLSELLQPFPAIVTV